MLLKQKEDDIIIVLTFSIIFIRKLFLCGRSNRNTIKLPDLQRTDLLQRQRHMVLFLLYQERSAISLSWVQHYRRSIKTTTIIIIVVIIVIIVITTIITIISLFK